MGKTIKPRHTLKIPDLPRLWTPTLGPSYAMKKSMEKSMEETMAHIAESKRADAERLAMLFGEELAKNSPSKAPIYVSIVLSIVALCVSLGILLFGAGVWKI